MVSKSTTTAEPSALETALGRMREPVANIIARAKWGSLCPEVGNPGDVPGGLDAQDYRAADAVLSLILADHARQADRIERLEAALTKAAICLSGFAGEGIQVDGFDDPADVYGDATSALGMPDADEADLRAALGEGDGGVDG